MFFLSVFICPRIRKKYICFRNFFWSKNFINILPKIFEHHKIIISSFPCFLCWLVESFEFDFHSQEVFISMLACLLSKKVSHPSSYFKNSFIIISEIFWPYSFMCINIFRNTEYIRVIMNQFNVGIVNCHWEILLWKLIELYCNNSDYIARNSIIFCFLKYKSIICTINLRDIKIF